jgi:uncharacterized membrane protein YcaP (DUF421 family)
MVEEIEVMAIDWHSLLVPKLPLIDVVMRTVLIYVILQVGLRLLGRKDLQHSASYNMVTLFLVGAFGGRAVLGEDTSLTACALGLVVVLCLNATVSFSTFRSRRLAEFFEGPIHQLIKDGVQQPEIMRHSRCSVDMLEAQLRGRGEADLNRVAQAYMERTGEISFIMKKPAD